MLGIDADAFFHWENDVDVSQFMNPAGNPNLVPAWTKAELDYMIGPALPKPDLLHPDKYSKYSKPDSWPLYFPGKMVEFSNGADAAACALVYLIEQEILDVETINSRYKQFYL